MIAVQLIVVQQLASYELTLKLGIKRVFNPQISYCYQIIPVSSERQLKFCSRHILTIVKMSRYLVNVVQSPFT